MMMGGGMMGGFGWGLSMLLWTAIVVGLALVIWLWVIKLWRETFRKK